MNGSPTHPACKHERGTTATEICVVIPHETGVHVLVRPFGQPPAGDGQPAPGTGAAPVAWRRRAGNPVVHAYAANACVDVPLCGSCFKSTSSSTELPSPPAHLGPYRRCRKCMKVVARGS